jgi:hypothetical protein
MGVNQFHCLNKRAFFVRTSLCLNCNFLKQTWQKIFLSKEISFFKYSLLISYKIDLSVVFDILQITYIHSFMIIAIILFPIPVALNSISHL